MCKMQIPQEESFRILAVGHKVMHQGKGAVITSIRVWHDMGVFVGPPYRHKVVFDLQGDGWSAVNTPLWDIGLWNPIPPMPESLIMTSTPVPKK